MFALKYNKDGEIKQYKARLVARGCVQKHGIDYEEVYSPVARYETIRILLAGYVEEEMHVHQMDVVSAYVQGDLMDEIYMEQPEMFYISGKEDLVCKLKRPLYGLKQAGREWYRKLNGHLLSMEFQRSNTDPCLYIKNTNGSNVIIVYVDDLLVSSIDPGTQDVKRMLKRKFKMKDLGNINKILEINIGRNGETGKMKLHQENYIKSLLEKFEMINSNPVRTPLEAGVKPSKSLEPIFKEEERDMKSKPYRELVRSLIYLSNTIRPDLAYTASTLSRFCSDLRKLHWQMAKRVLRYLRGTMNYGICYERCTFFYATDDWLY